MRGDRDGPLFARSLVLSFKNLESRPTSFSRKCARVRVPRRPLAERVRVCVRREQRSFICAESFRTGGVRIPSFFSSLGRTPVFFVSRVHADCRNLRLQYLGSRGTRRGDTDGLTVINLSTIRDRPCRFDRSFCLFPAWVDLIRASNVSIRSAGESTKRRSYSESMCKAIVMLFHGFRRNQLYCDTS